MVSCSWPAAFGGLGASRNRQARYGRKKPGALGGGWKPSPGAIYPALLALVETGHVRTADHDGTRVYSLTKVGRRVAAAQRSSSRWASLTARAEEGEDRVSVGSLLDAFAEASALRRRLARTEQRGRIEAILARASAEIEGTLEEGESDG